ncbi:hypothetical protein HMPREF9073_01890 [Capnocytophaga sp. oral taxon 326 str. F0382]|nr:hypothetical protein HMPREF9073_01890 [Capnocytophaga sp. oral taxon 326 str. F0382]
MFNGRLQNALTQHTSKVIDYQSNKTPFKYSLTRLPSKGEM